MVILSAQEKRQMCDALAVHLPKIRELLGATQAEFGELCGLSRITISRIENGSSHMNWSHLTSVLFICFVNRRTKEYFLANQLMGVRFLQFMQRKDENIPPETNIAVDEQLISAFQEGCPTPSL